MARFDSTDLMTYSADFSVEVAFTETYRQHMLAPAAIREAHCLRVQFEHLFDPIRPGDLFAGRTHYLPVGFGLEDAAGGPAYYCYEAFILPYLACLPQEPRRSVQETVDFWRNEATISGKLIRRFAARNVSCDIQSYGRDDGPVVRHSNRLRETRQDWTARTAGRNPGRPGK